MESALPDPAQCRVDRIGQSHHAACLVRHPARCQYALGFGEGHFCQHPERDHFGPPAASVPAWEP
ncbi:MAG: hypothetical protein IT580_08290 [Verrucomicrobiales bacterium]|nr:hypothetical protein [Verrucomicrobiales bacterium]